MLNVGVIGFGYWGPNIVRNFHAVEGMRVVAIADTNAAALIKASKQFPFAETFLDSRQIIQRPDIDVVAIVTSVGTHYALAKDALLNNKHVFVEKPFTKTTAEARELIALAEVQERVLMVDHTFLFTAAVKKIKELIDTNVLGNVLYYDSTRVNLGLFQRDCNVIWDLAPHDFSILNYLFDSRPVSISAHGVDHFDRNLENIAYVTVYLENRMMAHFNFNWLSPVKMRQTLIGGEDKMLVWNDLESDEKIKIYDKGIHLEADDSDQIDMRVEYRSGDISSPWIPHVEALQVEAEYFRDCIVHRKKPINDGYAGLAVVQMLEAVDLSIQNQGQLINLSEPAYACV